MEVDAVECTNDNETTNNKMIKINIISVKMVQDWKQQCSWANEIVLDGFQSLLHYPSSTLEPRHLQH